MADKRSVKISLSEEEFRLVEANAKARGLRVSAFARYCVFAYVTQHPAKGVFRDLHENEKS